jgi:hypothetical protein
LRALQKHSKKIASIRIKNVSLNIKLLGVFFWGYASWQNDFDFYHLQYREELRPLRKHNESKEFKKMFLEI